MTTTPTPPPALSSVLSTDEQFVVFHALADRYVAVRDRRAALQDLRCFGAADRATERLSLIESVVSKLPEFLRVEWAREVERVAS